MKLYAATPFHLLRQLLGDVLLLLWIAFWVWAGITVHDVTMELAGPGRQVAESATGLSGAMTDASGALAELPVVGEAARAPFDEAARAADRLAQAGRDQVASVERLALLLGVTVAAIAILLACLFHLPRRLEFVRRATAGARFVDANEDLDLFALRALSHQPLHVLARISDDPAGAWRRRDPDVVRRLAALELRDSGLSVPEVPVSGGTSA